MRDPDFKRARNLLMLNDALHGLSRREIAEKFRVSESTVDRALDWVKRANLVTQFEDRILQELVPEAIETFKRALKKDDTEVARDVFKGLGLLLKPQERATKSPSEEGEDLEIYIRKLRKAPEEGVNPNGRRTQFKPRQDAAQLASASEDDVIQGSILESPEDVSPAAAPSLRGSGDESCSSHAEPDVDLPVDDEGPQVEPAPGDESPATATRA